MAGGAAQRNMTEEAILSEKRVRAELGGGEGVHANGEPSKPLYPIVDKRLDVVHALAV